MCELHRASFKSYKIETSANLLYKLFIDPNGELQPQDYQTPTRGQLAFQTDLLIRNERVPLVVIETKFGGSPRTPVRHKEIRRFKVESCIVETVCAC